VDQVAKYSSNDRAALFGETAARMGFASPVIPEKDFWVCFILRRLFTLEFKPSILFKGGTSLSKAFELIERFSEDIDLTLNRFDLGFGGKRDPVMIEGRKARRRKIEKLATACSQVVRERLEPALRESIKNVIGIDGWAFELQDRDDGQVELHFRYPQGLPPREYGGLSYIPPAVRMEIGARSDQEPAQKTSIKSYAAQQFPNLFEHPDTEVLALAPERTFWEKVTIFHAEYFRPPVEGAPHPRAWKHLSLHAYDIAMMVRGGVADRALARLDLLAAVTHHKDTFFYRGWANYETAVPGSLHLLPGEHLAAALRHDYVEMAPMLFGDVPAFDEILRVLGELEDQINGSE